MNWFSELIISPVFAGKEAPKAFRLIGRLLFIELKSAFLLSWIGLCYWFLPSYIKELVQGESGWGQPSRVRC